MKLDKSVVQKIIIQALNHGSFIYDIKFVDFLNSLDLVIKPGDSSQSTLVENK